MGDWYTIGLALGLGLAIGVLLAGALATTPLGRVAAVVLAGSAGVVTGLLIGDWAEIVAGAAGGVVGAASALVVVAGALRRGGTRGGLALIVTLVALALAALAFVPIVGYVLALVVPAVGARSRRRQGERHAGLRILAKD
jgi:hypothetical protein